MAQTHEPNGEFTGRVAVITGAGQGIGRAVALGFAAAGARVVVNDRDADAADAVVSEITASGGEGIPAVASIGGGDGAEMIVGRSLDAFGRIDLLVNNAGIHNDTRLTEMDPAAIALNVEVNVLGTILVSRLVADHLIVSSRPGRIVNITSRAGSRGKAGETVYAAGKAAIAGFTLALSLELAPHKINVNAVAPAAWTPMLEQMEDPFRTQTIEKRKGNVLGRVAMPEDIFPTVAFLASERSAYLTGQVLQATGQPAAMF